MKLVGVNGQAVDHFMFDNSGLILSATSPQLILPRGFQRSQVLVQNISTHVMYLEIGSARATATITGGVVTSVTVTNPGFNFSEAPGITFRGGGASMYPGFLGSSDPLSPSPNLPATGHCVMSGTAPNLSVASIVVDYGGANYLVAPYVLIRNHHRDPNGCADPSYNAGSGILLPASGGSYTGISASCQTTDQMALYCGTLGSAFTVKWMD